jgi:hypothetical protein
MQPGDSYEIKSSYSPHKGHTLTLNRIEFEGTPDATAYWDCSCGHFWHNAWDPEGALNTDGR